MGEFRDQQQQRASSHPTHSLEKVISDSHLLHSNKLGKKKKKNNNLVFLRRLSPGERTENKVSFICNNNIKKNYCPLEVDFFFAFFFFFSKKKGKKVSLRISVRWPARGGARDAKTPSGGEAQELQRHLADRRPMGAPEKNHRFPPKPANPRQAKPARPSVRSPGSIVSYARKSIRWLLLPVQIGPLLLLFSSQRIS